MKKHLAILLVTSFCMSPINGVAVTAEQSAAVNEVLRGQIRYARMVNTAQANAFRETRRFVPLSELRVAPFNGSMIEFVVSDSHYGLLLRSSFPDAPDVVWTDDSGIILVGGEQAETDAAFVGASCAGSPDVQDVRLLRRQMLVHARQLNSLQVDSVRRNGRPAEADLLPPVPDALIRTVLVSGNQFAFVLKTRAACGYAVVSTGNGVIFELMPLA